ncbi:hypothetical protein D6D22_10227, partial [Aureobasidium pullulans]
VIILSALALALRIIVRSHEYGFEDTLLVLAFIFAMASFGCIYQALYDGLGISPQSLLEARTLRIAKLCLVLHCRGPLEAVDSSNVIQDHLQRYYARQDAYHSFSQCGMPHDRLDNISCRHLGFSMIRSVSRQHASPCHYTSFLSVSNISIEDWTGSNPGYQHLDRVVYFSVYHHICLVD